MASANARPALQMLHIRAAGETMARVEDSPGLRDHKIPVKGIVISCYDHYVSSLQLFGAQLCVGDT